MDWEQCLEGNVSKRRPDLEEAAALLKMAGRREAYISAAKRTKEFTPLVVEAYYEIAKELITGIMAADGYKSYSHECLITFAEKFCGLPKGRVVLLDQLRKIRNEINYRGASVDPSYLERNETEIGATIAALKALLRKRLPRQ